LRATREIYWNAADAEKHSPDLSLKHTCKTGSDRSAEGRKMLMDKKQREAAVLNGGLAELVVRQVNAEPWEPVPGMVRGALRLVPLLVRRAGEQRDTAMP
jgi:hypothetical protein